jgi:hypothetical protein
MIIILFWDVTQLRLVVTDVPLSYIYFLSFLFFFSVYVPLPVLAVAAGFEAAPSEGISWSKQLDFLPPFAPIKLR